MVSHAVRLSLGFTADFIWADGHMTVEWAPGVPHIRNPRHRRKLFDAYARARTEFMEMVAALVGGRIAIVDLEGGTARLTAVVEPPVRH